MVARPGPGPDGGASSPDPPPPPLSSTEPPEDVRWSPFDELEVMGLSDSVGLAGTSPPDLEDGVAGGRLQAVEALPGSGELAPPFSSGSALAMEDAVSGAAATSLVAPPRFGGMTASAYAPRGGNGPASGVVASGSGGATQSLPSSGAARAAVRPAVAGHGAPVGGLLGPLLQSSVSGVVAPGSGGVGFGGVSFPLLSSGVARAAVRPAAAGQGAQAGGLLGKVVLASGGGPPPLASGFGHLAGRPAVPRQAARLLVGGAAGRGVVSAPGAVVSDRLAKGPEVMLPKEGNGVEVAVAAGSAKLGAGVHPPVSLGHSGHAREYWKRQTDVHAGGRPIRSASFSGGPSFVDAVSGAPPPRPAPRPRFSAMSLPSRQVGSKEGMPMVSFSGAEIGACEKRFEHSIIAKFTVGRPSLSEIQRVFQDSWTITGRASLSDIWDNRHVLVIFDSEDDVRVALSSSLNKVGHAYFRLFRWQPDYNPKKESTITTVWVRLPGLPLSIYDSAFIAAIVSTFGYYVNVDDRTRACTSLRFARACVEIDVTKPVPKAIWINLPDNRGYWQSIEVEGSMYYCGKCKVHGHSFATCRKVKASSDSKPNGPKGSSESEGQGPRGVGLSHNGKDKLSTLDISSDAPNVIPDTSLGEVRAAAFVPSVSVKDKALPTPVGLGVRQGGLASQWQLVRGRKRRNRAAVRGPGLRAGHETSEIGSEVPHDEVTKLSKDGGVDMIRLDVGNVQSSGAGVPNDFSRKELTLIDGATSSQLVFNESMGVLLHPKAVEWYNKIQQKSTHRDAQIIPGESDSYSVAGSDDVSLGGKHGPAVGYR